MAVQVLEGRLGLRAIRVSAVRFQPERRKAARRAEAAGDPGPISAWRDDFNATFAGELPASDVDLLLGDMWIWGPQLCSARTGLNLHPALPTGPLGVMWFDAIWDLVAADAVESGVMIHRVTAAVDEGPVVAFARYNLRHGALAPLWAELPTGADRAELIDRERRLRRDSTHPLFVALRAAGLAREAPLVLETLRAMADGRFRLVDGEVLAPDGARLAMGVDLTPEVERVVRQGQNLAVGETH